MYEEAWGHLLLINIRRATRDDAAVVAELVNDLLAEIMHAISVQAFDSNRQAMQRHLSESIPTEQHFVLLAEQEDTAVGFAAISPAFALYNNGAFGIITELFVLPAFRSQRIGARLVRQCESFARETGWTRLEVTTPPQPQFQRTLSFYRNNGFDVTGGPKLKLAIEKSC